VDALLAKRFGRANVVHAHRGALDHVFLISSKHVRLTEVGTEVMTDNGSDHDMATVTVRAALR